MNGVTSEIRPGVRRLRVYAGRRANWTPIQISRTLVSPEAAEGLARPGDGTRLADRELAKTVAKVDEDNEATTVRRVHALIGAALHQAEKWDLVERNVARRAWPPHTHGVQVTAPDRAQVRVIVVDAERSNRRSPPSGAWLVHALEQRDRHLAASLGKALAPRSGGPGERPAAG